MQDIDTGLTIIGGIAFAFFFLGVIIGAYIPRWVSYLIIVATVAGMVAYAITLRNSLRLAQIIPYSNVIVTGNWLAVGTGIVAGFSWELMNFSVVRKYFLIGSMMLLSMLMVYQPVSGKPPECSDEWNGDVCMQTTEETCTAASAATYLKIHGIPASESEMANLCLTREKGTSMLGLYRGLKLKSKGTGLDVHVGPSDLAGILKPDQPPLLISVKLPPTTSLDSPYVTQWGLKPGIAHTVVLLKIDGNMMKVADPAVGYEDWKVEQFQELWTRESLYLAPRKQ